MTTTSTDDVASVLAARKASIQGPPPQTEYPDQAVEVIPAADSRTGEIVPVSTATTTPGGEGTPRPPVAPSAAVEPARPPTDYSMIPAKVLGGIPYASEYARLAKTIANTEMVPMTMRGAWDKVMAAFMRGYEMGLGPMQALDSFNVIEGKVGLKAEAMRALIMDAGHQIILEDVYGGEDGMQVTAIDAVCHRSDWPADQWRTYSYSMQDAALGGLLHMPRSGRAGAWQKTPRAMMDARATSGAGRRYFADVLAGMSYTPEEIRDFDGPQEEATPSPRPSTTPATAAETPAPAPSSSQPESPSSSPPPTLSPSAASAPEASPAPAPAPAAPADSTASASATSSADSAGSAPPTATPPKKPKGSTKKAAAKSTAAPSAPAPAASTAPPAAAPAESTAAPSTPGTASATAPPASPEAASPPPANGEAGVLAQMAHALVEIVNGQPAAQQPLLRAFLRQHFPNGIDAITTEAELQKAIDIAVGWPESAEQHPPPEQPGIEKWKGFSTSVVEVDRELEARCTLCEWRLPQAETQKNLPEFRQIELAAATCISHEQDSYADGTPYCPGRPTQPELS